LKLVRENVGLKGGLKPMESPQQTDTIENQEHSENFQLYLVGGGLVERNLVLMPNDKMIAYPLRKSNTSSPSSAKTREQKREERLKMKLERKKRPRNFVPKPMIKSTLAAFDPL